MALEVEAKVAELLTSVLAESHRNYNHNQEVVYPYMTYQTELEMAGEDLEAINLDCQLFDRSTSDKRLLEVEYKLKSAIDKVTLLEDKYLMMVRFVRSGAVSTNDDNIVRRDLSFRIKIYRR